MFPCSSSGFIWFSPWSSIVFICFSNALPRGEYVNLAYSVIVIWSDGNISSPVRYFIIFYSILADDNADIFVGSVLLLHCTFSPLILSSMVMINFYIHSKIFFLKHEELSNGRVVSITKKEYVFVEHFL